MLLYGAGATKLAAQLNISFNEAKELMNKYFMTFPKIKELMDSLIKNATETRTAISLLDNRRIDLGGIDWTNKGHVAHAMNQARNLPFQGCGTSITKLALCYVDIELKKQKLKAKLVNVVHDLIRLWINPINCWKLLLSI